MSSAGDKGKGQRVSWLKDILRRAVKPPSLGAQNPPLLGSAGLVQNPAHSAPPAGAAEMYSAESEDWIVRHARDAVIR